MGLIDDTKPIIPLSGVAELLKVKSRTLRMYEDKGLLPKHDGMEKKQYSLQDIQKIALVHYLASVKKVNANGIRYFFECMESYLPDEIKKTVFDDIEKKFEMIPSQEIDADVTI